jgi:dienelactone hydrolase
MTGSFEYDSFFTCEEYLLKRYDRFSRQLGFSASSEDEYEFWASELRSSLRRVIGLDTMVRAPLAPRFVGVTDMETYIREEVTIQTEPGVIMPMYVLIPKQLQVPAPSVIAPHGHDSGGKLATAGRTDLAKVREAIQKYQNDYGVQLVNEGFVVFCPDARGFGQRRELPHQSKPEEFLNSSCQVLNNMAIPLGQTVTGMWTWDLMRLVDYIEEYRDECDPERIGCAGLSGGGHQTLWLSALDHRIKCAVISGYFYGYRDALLKLNTNCSCNYVPNLWQVADMGDIGALIAPRPLLVETGNRDPLNGETGLANVTEQIDITRSAYALFDAASRLCHHVFDGEHRWDGTKAVPWLVKWLQG